MEADDSKKKKTEPKIAETKMSFSWDKAQWEMTEEINKK